MQFFDTYILSVQILSFQILNFFKKSWKDVTALIKSRPA